MPNCHRRLSIPFIGCLKTSGDEVNKLDGCAVKRLQLRLFDPARERLRVLTFKATDSKRSSCHLVSGHYLLVRNLFLKAAVLRDKRVMYAA
jgi:hypothetical protein